MMRRSEFAAIGVWIGVFLLGTIALIQWRQLEVLTDDAGVPVQVLQFDGTPLFRLETPPRGLPVDLVYLSVNEGVFSNVEGGFIQTSPIQILDEDGNFVRYLRTPVSLSEPVEVHVEGGQVDVWVEGGFLDVDTGR